MPVVVNDIIEVSIKASLDFQLILNILHYKINATASALSVRQQMQSMAELFATDAAYIDAWRDMMGADYEVEEVICQDIYPIRYARFRRFFTPVKPGTAAGTACSSSSGICVTKQGDLTGPHQHGTIHITGIPNTQLPLGLLKNTFYGTVITGVASFLTEFIDADVTYEPVIFNKEQPANSVVVTEFAVEPEVRTMRRRVVGRGK